MKNSNIFFAFSPKPMEKPDPAVKRQQPKKPPNPPAEPKPKPKPEPPREKPEKNSD